MEHAADPLIGRVLDGRYRVGPRVARGGMATVYQATDLRLDRTVAVKVMHAGLADDDDFVARFEREARSAARLAHHNVVAVFDQGEDAGTLFLVMEYVPGLTLRDMIRKEAPMAPAKALTVLEPVLAALGAAHRAGMIHRDVKPENVLLADNGEVKVADFGLARAVNAETQHTATGGVLIGTVSYLSPELVTDGRADARADVYAAGVLLYEMLTGQKPHQADTPIQVAYKHVHEDIPAPSRLRPGIPGYVDALVARATCRDTTLRPADASVLLHQVHRVRNALEQGVAEDPDLTADLTPRKVADTEGTDELPVEIIDPSRSGAATELVQLRGTATPARLPAVEDDAGRPPYPVVGPVYPAAPRRSGRRRGPLVLAMLVALAVLVALGAWYLGFARYTVTPGVIELSQSAARAKVEQAGLDFEVSGRKYSETVVRGAVVSTDPAAGARIRKDGTVSAVISRGPERHEVPHLRGMTLAQAEDILASRHLAMGRTIERFSGKVKQGRVVRSDPQAGTEQRRNAAIDLVVSKGPKPIKIPDFTGKSADKATKRLKKLGFEVDTSDHRFDDRVPSGHVISQSPDSGTGHRGDEVSLVVSKGPQFVELPDVRRMSYDDAKAELERLGLKVERHQTPFYIGLDRVAQMDPAPGKEIPRGSTVTLDLV